MNIIETTDKKRYWTEQYEETPNFIVFDRVFPSGVTHKYKVSKENVALIIEGVKVKPKA